MLLVDSTRVTTQAGEFHLKWRGRRSPVASPKVEVDDEFVLSAVGAGVNVLQLRTTQRDLVIASVLVQVVQRATQPPLTFIRTPLAASSAGMAQGLGSEVHLPEEPAAGFTQPQSIDRVRAFPLGESMIISRSVHSVETACAAEREGADMLVLGTVFPSTSHPGGPTIGPDGVREVCAAVSIPVIGIGGITAANAGDVIRAGASGVAVISAIFNAKDPEEAARELRRAVDAAWAERQ
jgi:thiamine monophosphate synthase